MTEIIEKVKKLFLLEDCTFTPVSGHEGGRNRIVIVSRDAEKQYVLRISDLGDRSEDDYLAETEFVHFLAEQGAPVADVVPSVQGRLVECLETDGEAAYVSLFAYAKGMLLRITATVTGRARLLVNTSITPAKLLVQFTDCPRHICRFIPVRTTLINTTWST